MQLAQDKAISITEAANRLGVSPRTIKRMIDSHQIKAFKIMGQWRMRESEIERLMRSGEEREEERKDD
jgi:excisionase family DNA binding protein